MPDTFDPWRYSRPFDAAPSDATVPPVSICDPPFVCAHINLEWLKFVIPVIDRLGYPDVWSGTEADKAQAFDEINDWLGSLVACECNSPLWERYDMASYAVNAIAGGGGVLTFGQFTVPAGERWLVTGGMVMTSGTTVTSIRHDAISFGVTTFLLLKVTPAAYEQIRLPSPVWLNAGTVYNFVFNNPSAGNELYAQVSVEKWRPV